MQQTVSQAIRKNLDADDQGTTTMLC
jgi:hypothetical protein